MDEPTTLAKVYDPLALIAMALEKGLDPDKLGKLMDLQERWEHQRAVREYNDAMQRCQAEIPEIVCDSINTHTKSKYPSVESIQRKIKPIYTRHGLALSFDEGETIDGLCRTSCEVMHAAGHSRHYHLDLPLDGTGIKGNANMTPIHGRLSADTYAQGRLLRKIFNLTIVDDATDNDSTATPRTIIGEQVGELNDIMLKYEATVGHSINLQRFLQWLGATSLNTLTEAQFLRGKTELLRRINTDVKGR